MISNQANKLKPTRLLKPRRLKNKNNKPKALFGLYGVAHLSFGFIKLRT